MAHKMDFEAKRVELLTEYARALDELARSREELYNSEIHQAHQRAILAHRKIRARLSSLDRKQSKTL